MSAFSLQRILPVLLASAFTCGPVCAQLAPPSLDGLLSRYDSARDEITQKQWVKPMENLRTRYRETMTRVQAGFSAVGDLKNANAARAAVKEDPTAAKISTVEKIAPVQTIFLEQKKKIKLNLWQSLEGLSHAHVAELTAYKLKLTKLDLPVVAVERAIMEFRAIARTTAGVTTAGVKPKVLGVMGGRCNSADRASRMREAGGKAAMDRQVLQALRWIKTQQQEDGHFGTGKYPVAMTAFALLAFCGHCETVDSPEFGQTVKAAIEYLINVAERNKGYMMSSNDRTMSYEHGIAVYALAEAYSLNKNARISGLCWYSHNTRWQGSLRH